jgi:hypothetical protein
MEKHTIKIALPLFMPVTRITSIFLVAGVLLLSFCGSADSKSPTPKKGHVINRNMDKISKENSISNAVKFADSMRPILRKSGFSSRLLFVADMGLHMHIKRFYVVRMDSSKVIKSFLVAHGQGGGSTWDSVVFSNVPGSLCSSKGRYKIGTSYYGNFGKGYRLHGLDKTNNNALKRLVVFHAFNTQTEAEYGRPNYMSSGCPMLAPKSFAYCDSLIQLEKKPVMMVIY